MVERPCAQIQRGERGSYADSSTHLTAELGQTRGKPWENAGGTDRDTTNKYMWAGHDALLGARQFPVGLIGRRFRDGVPLVSPAVRLLEIGRMLI